MVNPLGTKGNIVRAFSSILHTLWHGEMPFITPFEFRVCITPAIFKDKSIDIWYNSVPSASMPHNSAVQNSMIRRSF